MSGGDASPFGPRIAARSRWTLSRADAHLAGLSDAELDAFEALLEWPDPDLYAWVSGEALPPPQADHAVLGRLRSFHVNAEDQNG